MISLSLLTAAALIVFLWKLDYYTLSPGSARETAPFIQIEGAPTFPDQEGMVDYLTVSVKQATPADAFLAWIDPAIDIVDAELVLGSQTPSENRELNLQLMASSKDSATYQALQRLGYEIPISGTGAVIASVAADVPAAAVLERGDTVVSVDGRPVAVSQDLSGQVAALPPGAVIELGVQPFEGGDTRVVSVELVVRPDDPTRSMIGVSTFTRDLTFDFPVQVTIDSGQVGGPSAGLAFTLGILDALTPESITGGARVATTGTMELDGTVGPVGGVHQKVVAASREGVDLMLVPSAELEEARRYGGDLRIEPVDDLDDALAVLATMGGGDAVLPAPTEAVPVG
ncbi:MAG: PDZ domain-containing protein [Acidimicrobiales bacterium]|nr:PDZ domain-containing protein [Acidimicrobiales bacterium]